jgi:acyl dehydratase
LEEAAMLTRANVIVAGYEFQEELFVTRQEIVEFARLCRDENPLHHDDDFARRTRFQGVIASGPHIMCFFTSMVATHLSRLTPMIGLDFSFKFLAPVRPDTTITMQWKVVRLEPAAKLRGVLADLEGVVRCAERPLISGRGVVLLTGEL